MELFDCTLRDGANVVGSGFSAEHTKIMFEGLIACGIHYIEFGNALGVGTPEHGKGKAPLTDEEYLELMQPYIGTTCIGMFMGALNAEETIINLCAEKGLNFLRIGLNAGDGKSAKNAIHLVKRTGMKAFYSIMKGYICSPAKLADEALMLQDFGLDAITIMDSAGTMLPSETAEYITALKNRVNIPVGFHGHNNIGLSAANALTAYEAGADLIDCGLMGMARSAGNLATEVAIALFNRIEESQKYGDLYNILHFIDNALIPAMKDCYSCPIKPIDLIFGYAGCHSSYLPRFMTVATEKGVDLYKLIVEVSKVDKKNPSIELISRTAEMLL